MPKDFGFPVLVFVAVCGLFVFKFSIRFSVFVENNRGLTLLLSYVVCIRFSVFSECFGSFAVLDDFFRFLIYPSVSLH